MTDFHDLVLDARAEIVDGIVPLTTAQIVRSTLDYEQSHDIYRHLSPAARHPFGLPISGSSSARAMTPNAPAANPSPAAGATGHTDFPAAA